jgi:membrane-bound lytic murein transglycosylase MltF
VAKPVQAPEEPAQDQLWSTIRLDELWKGDLDGIVKRGRLRVLVTYSLTNYFLDGAQPRGITYELVENFIADLNRSLGLRSRPIVSVYIPVARDAMLAELAAGRGDIAAANLTVTESRAATVDFSTPLHTGIRELLVSGPGGPAAERIEDFAGTDVWVRPSSSYRESLAALNAGFRERGLPLVRIRPADEYLEIEDILELVSAGTLPATVVDSHLIEFWSDVLPKLRVHDETRRARRGSTIGNVLYARYLRENRWVRDARSSRESKRLTGMVDHFEKYGELYGFDWRLLAAQAYQESRLDHAVTSSAGAVGVMQLLPSTAASREVGIPDIAELEQNIHAGAKYLRVISDNYFDDLEDDPLNRHLFSIAAYNAGATRIRRLRREAAALGLDPDLWFENVEVVAARRIGAEPVRYVANIYKYYIAYRLEFHHQERRRRLMQDLAGGAGD